ncbi:DUF309 domain-containing protein [Tautonia sociabilis]|uniref:DUF309 domain-containing protein n=2 Tax=Tautonia sociabilis TaxID=2080755 RepID=A0A432MMI5_9BACT|nr:DUF309 domain-containing protein [Tautonia sociabilis]
MPPFTYIPGGPWPRPSLGAAGLLAGKSPRGEIPPIGEEHGASSPAFRLGVRLYNAGYYWEAHEAWETLWHAIGRTGPTADVLKGLITLAAAGVKVRQGQPRGVATHAGRAAVLFRASRERTGRDRLLGIDLVGLEAVALRVAARPPVGPGPEAGVVPGLLGPPIEPLSEE